MRNLTKIGGVATILLAFLFAAFAPLGRGAEPTATACVQKWEYSQLMLLNIKGNERTVTAFGPDGKREEMTERQAAAKFNSPNCLPIELMNDMGSRGWELVSNEKEVADVFVQTMIIFKRPK